MLKFVEGRVWPAMLTPLDESGEPQLDQIERLVTLFAEQKLGGIFVLGSTGQGVLLNPDQRRRAAQRAVKAAGGAIPIMVHVGSQATDDAIGLAKHAAEIGADAISSVPPIYYPTSAATTFEHYRRIGSATDLPFFPYHATFLRQSVSNAREYAERLLGLPNLEGMKFTDHDLYSMGLLHRYSGGRLKIFSGPDELLCQAAVSGAVGAIGTFYNQFGPACQAARERFVAGDVAAGKRFMSAFGEMIDRVLSADAMWSFHRRVMQRKYGIEIGAPRAPLGTVERDWDEAEIEELIALVDGAVE